MTVALDSKRLRRAFGCFPTGVAAVAAVIDGDPTGMAISSFTSVSLDPPLAAICIAATSGTWLRLRTSAELGVSVLSADQHLAGRQLAAASADRFAGIDWHATAGGALLIHAASATLETRIHREIEAGDHTLVLLEVLAVDPSPDVTPLVFHGSIFRRLHP